MSEQRIQGDLVTGSNLTGQSYQYTTGTYPVGQNYTNGAVYETTYTNGASYAQGGANYIQGGATYASNVQNVQIPQGGVVNTVVNTGKEVIKGESRIEYVPFEKKII